MKIFPYDHPIILTDAIFAAYGGVTGSNPHAMLQAAYLIAEQQMSNYIGTLLLPTMITGSWDYSMGGGYLATDYGYVQELLWVKVIDRDKNTAKILNDVNNFAAVNEDTYGYIFVQTCLQECGCLQNYPYKFQAGYIAGLPSGIAWQPAMLMALAGAAQITLNELQLVSANESTGDVGVTEYSSLGYSEKRKPWKNTAFGSSPQAAKISQLVDSTFKKARRSVMFGR